MASRSVWSGTVVLGDVAVPVSMHVAQKRDEISYKTLHAGCYAAVKQTKACAHDGATLKPADIVKGYEFSPGQYVLADTGADVEASDEIRLERFVRAGTVPLLHLDRSYSLAPADDDASRHAYDVLLRALERTGMAGLGRLTMYGKQNVVLVQAIDDAVYLTTLFLRRDIRVPVADRPDVDERELRLASKLIRQLAGDFDPDALAGNRHDLELAQLQGRIDAGDTVAAPDVAVAPVDLADALRKSVRTTSR